MCHCVSTASSWRVYGACTAFACSVIVSIALSQRRQGAATATIALPRRSHYVHRRLPLRCEQTQPNGIKAASSLPPPLCVQAWSTSSWLLNASKPGYSLPIFFMQVQDDANVVHLIQRRRRRRAPRGWRVWVRQWLDVDRRLQYGHYHRLMYELRYEDPASYFNFLRVPPDMFDELLRSSLASGARYFETLFTDQDSTSRRKTKTIVGQ